jgi:hypothetical protein
MSAQDQGDIALRCMFCNFIVASALMVLARLEDNMEAKLQRYLEARHYIRDYSNQLENGAQGLDDVVMEDLSGKLGPLLVFDFEAAIALKSWDNLAGIARRATTATDLGTLHAMADCILRATEAPTQSGLL